jgi:hypothetical protein
MVVRSKPGQPPATSSLERPTRSSLCIFASEITRSFGPAHGSEALIHRPFVFLHNLVAAVLRLLVRLLRASFVHEQWIALRLHNSGEGVVARGPHLTNFEDVVRPFAIGRAPHHGFDGSPIAACMFNGCVVDWTLFDRHHRRAKGQDENWGQGGEPFHFPVDPSFPRECCSNGRARRHHPCPMLCPSAAPPPVGFQ